MSEAASVLGLPGVRDGAIEEANHYSETLFGLILQEAVRRILYSEDLRASVLVLCTGFDDLFWPLVRGELILVTIDKANWEVTLWISKSVLSG